VLTIFNRPDLTELVLRAIAEAQPKRLFVLADGPRDPSEAELCARTRAIIDRVDWDCDVRTNFSEENMGCRERCASGFTWVFSQAETAIFLDDDCLPDPTFFPFCEAMLDLYRDDCRVMMITGSNYVKSWKADRQSYHFSNFGSPWGWASWSRAWSFYDVSMQAWAKEASKTRVREVLADEECYAFQARRFDILHSNPGDRHSWDLPWSLARLLQGGLTVVPSVNLISNYGCSGEGNALPPNHPIAYLPTTPMRFPIRIQETVAVDRLYDLEHVRRFTTPYVRDQVPGPSSSIYGRVTGNIRSRLTRLARGLVG
jgi:hypothetical protein